MTVSDNGSPMMFGGDGFGSGGFIWAFLIFALLMGNGGFGFGGGNGNSNAIQNDINRGFDNQNLQAQTRDILGAHYPDSEDTDVCTEGKRAENRSKRC